MGRQEIPVDPAMGMLACLFIAQDMRDHESIQAGKQIGRKDVRLCFVGEEQLASRGMAAGAEP